MKIINKQQTSEELFVLGQKLKMAKIMLSFLSAKLEGKLNDTIFMFEDNQTMYDYLQDQLVDYIDFAFDENDDFNNLINFIKSASDHLKEKLGL